MRATRTSRNRVPDTPKWMSRKKALAAIREYMGTAPVGGTQTLRAPARRRNEQELQTAIIVTLKRFLLELGRDFAFVGEQYLLPVGGQDFRLDLLFYHRELQSLIAIELKGDEFKPEYLGKLEFYLEALDRDVRKSHENPSIGVLLCASKDNEVVEYALSRAASPALIAEYQTPLPDRRNAHGIQKGGWLGRRRLESASRMRHLRGEGVG